MKKIILLSFLIGSFVLANAQKATVIRYGISNGILYNLATDSIYKTRINQVTDASLRFEYTYTNGNKALVTGDTVVINLTGFAYGTLKDTFFLKEDLAANATIALGNNIPNNPDANNFEIIRSGKEWRTISGVCASVVYATQYGKLIKAPDLCLPMRIVNTTDTKESTASTVRIHPNPARETLTFTNVDNANISIFNITGQNVKQYNNVTGNMSINVQNLIEGIYFVRIQTGKNVHTEKIKIIK